MADFTVKEVLSEYIKRNSNKYPEINIDKLLAYNKFMARFPEDRWYHQFNYEYIARFDVENISVSDLINCLKPYQDDKSFIVSASYAEETMTVFKITEVSIDYVLSSYNYTISKFISSYLNCKDIDSVIE